jgi:hypothetical protein
MVNVTRDQYLQNFFRIHNLKTKQKLLLSSFFSHILSPFCTLPIHILDKKRERERERERERALPKQFQNLLVQTNQRRSFYFFLVFEINSLAIINLCKSKWLVFRASKSKLSSGLENQSKFISNYVVTVGTQSVEKSRRKSKLLPSGISQSVSSTAAMSSNSGYSSSVLSACNAQLKVS